MACVLRKASSIMKVTRITLYSVPLSIGMNLTRYVAGQIIDPAIDSTGGAHSTAMMD